MKVWCSSTLNSAMIVRGLSFVFVFGLTCLKFLKASRRSGGWGMTKSPKINIKKVQRSTGQSYHPSTNVFTNNQRWLQSQPRIYDDSKYDCYSSFHQGLIACALSPGSSSVCAFGVYYPPQTIVAGNLVAVCSLRQNQQLQKASFRESYRYNEGTYQSLKFQLVTTASDSLWCWSGSLLCLSDIRGTLSRGRGSQWLWEKKLLALFSDHSVLSMSCIVPLRSQACAEPF